MDVKWEEVVVRLNRQAEETDPFLAAKAQEMKGGEKRARMLPPRETVYKAETHWKGAGYDHFGNLFRAIREGGKVVEDPEFGFRACAPALLCNDSYLKGTVVHWDPVNMRVIS